MEEKLFMKIHETIQKTNFNYINIEVLFNLQWWYSGHILIYLILNNTSYNEPSGGTVFILFFALFLFGGAVPGGTAIPGQPVAKAEQAPDTSPCSKNQFNIVVSQWETYQILSW